MTDVHRGGNDWQLLHSQAYQQMFPWKLLPQATKWKALLPWVKFSPVTRMKCLQLRSLQTTNRFTFVHVVGYLPYSYFYSTSIILHYIFHLWDVYVYDLNPMLRYWGDDGEAAGEKAVKSETTFWDCITTFINIKPLAFFKEISGQVQAEFAATKTNTVG